MVGNDFEKSNIFIYKTSNYDLFLFDSLNREPKHYGNIVESIKANDYTPYNPILVNPSNEGGFTIIDGQNRFMACRTLKKPIYFVVASEASIDDAPQLNNASKNWDMMDYIKHFAGKGMYDYMVILDIVENHSIPLTAVITIATTSENSAYRDIKSGKYKLNPKRDIYDFIEHYNEFSNYIPFYKKAQFVQALGGLFFNDEYDKERMLGKLKLYSGIVNDQPSRTLLKVELEKLYNYKVLPNNKVKFTR